MFNFNPNIVENGLVVYMDAANPKSYVSGATTWNDLTRNQTNSTFVSASTYNSNNLGSVSFNGSGDFAYIGPTTGYTMAPDDVTMLFWVNGNFSGHTLGVFERITDKGSGITQKIPNNGWVQVGYMSSGTTNFFIINGVRHTPTVNGAYVYQSQHQPLFSSSVSLFGHPSTINFAFSIQTAAIGGVSTYEWVDRDNRLLCRSSTGAPEVWAKYFTGNTASVMIYNRTLSQGEALQNYNAMKSRFGL